MKAITILESIQTSIDKHTLPKVQKGDYKSLISNYSELLKEYSELTPEEQSLLFENVKKQRPLIGKKLKEELDKDLNL